MIAVGALTDAGLICRLIGELDMRRVIVGLIFVLSFQVHAAAQLTPPVDPNVTTAPTKPVDSTTSTSSSVSRTKQPPTKMVVPDGQLRTKPFWIYVNHRITWQNQPRLILQQIHVISAKQPGEALGIAPLRIARARPPG